mmetsp:Transcript_39108/g.55053  ORF Transcript_39108/g.55053 Transcript_39108/m.55053 type:complete len:432 (-) Transcript_39108:405-1700(-)|eukprot:CAMPEP_0202442022 /NCGR_PEP_ID=MMETSP1360-20130828/1522_1 /ASSEMBLY_ACC=CAM_ASM_000848 /TAXON_ID=515479 /ORGANISM="Licmophora paradoxa, Strain CCMP2313" /LENGTH=431 /DNA_ID=CAMNT_0049057259 /DNA_START=97 /DNA_END=1392 /DNA_ORIENTATION=-
MSEDQWNDNPNHSDPSANKEGQPPQHHPPPYGPPPTGPHPNVMQPSQGPPGGMPQGPRYTGYPPPVDYPPPQPHGPSMIPPPHDMNQPQPPPGYPPPHHGYPPQGWGQPQYPHHMYPPYPYPPYAGYPPHYPPPQGYEQPPPPPYGAEATGYLDHSKQPGAGSISGEDGDEASSFARMKLYVKSKVPTRQEILDRRERKNSQSRSRAAKMRDRMKEIAEKPAEERNEEEKSLLDQFEARRQRKNDRSRERAIERKSEIDRILNKPERKRSKLEKQFLETALTAKQRKNEGDRLRRQRIKVLGKKGPVKGVQARPPGSAAAIADSAARAAKVRYEQQLPMSPLPSYAYAPPPMGYPPNVPTQQISPKSAAAGGPVGYIQGGGQYDDAPPSEREPYDTGGEDGMPPMLLYDQDNGEVGSQEDVIEEPQVNEQL